MKHLIRFLSMLALLVTLVYAAPIQPGYATSAGGVKAWGSNAEGKLGTGTYVSAPTPVDVIDLPSGATAIAGGYAHSCAVTGDGGVKCWGDNYWGQLGDGTTTRRLSPVNVYGLTSGVTAIAGGYVHSCAVTGDGGVKCWGNNYWGQLGDGTTTNSSSPVDVSGLTSGVVAIAAGGQHHTCALMSGGGVKCWGYNANGQVGDGTTAQHLTPVDVIGLTSGVTAIAGGARHTCAVMSGGGVKCWGYNANGQVGDGTTVQRLTPVDVNGLTSGVTAIAAGYWHTCAVTSGGGVKCWGYNAHGQLGDGTNTGRLTPVDVIGLTSGVTAIAGGEYHTCAVVSGAVKCWGANWNYTLGNGTNVNSTVPVNVSGLTSGATVVAEGANHSLAIIVADTTPPEITPTIAGTLGDNGWYTSDVTVSWTVSDPESSISSTSGCDTAVINTDTPGATLTCTATSQGGTASQSVTVKRDATAPTITFDSRTPAANANGWNNTGVTVNWSCADSLSGVVAEAVSQILGEEGADQSATGTCADLAGNTAADTQSGISIDKTSPTLAPSVSPDPVLLNGSATVTSGAEDGLSGLASESCGTLDTSTVGVKTVTCTATDNAGNTASQSSVSYRVHYGFSGFLQPINDTAHQTCPGCPTSIFKGGSTVPVKFQLKDANGAVVQAAGVPQWVTPQRGGPTNAPVDEGVYSDPATTGTTYRWDSQAQQYIFNWSTKGFAIGYYWRIGVLLDDGQTYYVYIGLR